MNFSFLKGIYTKYRELITKDVQIDLNNLPEHIGIIMDGNGRWAKQKGLSRKAGHMAGAETLREISDYCSSIGIKALTAYAFSTENWRRSKEEVDALMDLIYEYLCDADRQLAGRDNVVRIIGDKSMLRPEIQKQIEIVENKTKDCKGMVLNLAVNYGGREEITRAAKTLAKKVKAGQLDPDDINEQLLSDNMYTASLPMPDIIIRPSGELRLSNFMLWQAAYSEFWFDDLCWPDFTPKDMNRVICDYQKRARRFGGR